jgi:hypothetical protein
MDVGKALIPVALAVNWVLWRSYWRADERLAERERKLDDLIARALEVQREGNATAYDKHDKR